MSTIGERPGVYATYEVANASYSGSPRGTVGLAALTSSGESGKVKLITSAAAAMKAFGDKSGLTELVSVLFKNGAAAVKVVAIVGEAASAQNYEDAFELLASQEDVGIILCDSRNADVHAKLKDAIMSADERNRYKIGIVEGTGDVSALTDSAKNLNCERMVMVAPSALDESGEEAVAGALAAAVAGAILLETDPAVPLNGAELFGLGGISESYNDADIDALILGGVTCVESRGGSVAVVRGITTKTTTGDTYDPTYRELTTVRIIDDVIPTVTNALKTAFVRTKNTAQTRGAIRTRVIMELEKKLGAEIIDAYSNVTVAANASDPTVCDVNFEFTVAHGLNQIRISAHIAV